MRTKSLLIGFSVLAWLGAASPAAWAEDAAPRQGMGIAAVVNEDAISTLDVEERMRFMLASSGMPDSPSLREKLFAQALRGLIDEKLQLQEARKLNVVANDTDIEKAIAKMELDRGGKAGDFRKFLQTHNISEQTVRQQIGAQISWSKIVLGRVRSQVQVSDDEVDQAIERMLSQKNGEEFLVQRLFLPVVDSAQKQKTEALGAELANRIKGGADFEKMIAQFSGAWQQDGAGENENTQWIFAYAQEPQLQEALRAAGPGEVVGPITLEEGVIILKVLQRRDAVSVKPENTKLALRQIVMPLSEKASKDEVDAKMKEGERIRSTTQDCATFMALAEKLNEGLSSDFGLVAIKDLHPQIRKLVAHLEAGDASEPFRTPKGVHLLMVCGKVDGTPTPDREKLREVLFVKKLEQEAYRFLRNLRRQATIEVRL